MWNNTKYHTSGFKCLRRVEVFLRHRAPGGQLAWRLCQRLRGKPLAPWAFPLPREPQLLTDKAEALGLWPPHPPASFSCQGLDQSPGRVACDLWPHKRSPQGQSQPLFTSLNFIYRANKGSPTPKAGQASLKTEAAHPLPPCQPPLNPTASVGGPTACNSSCNSPHPWEKWLLGWSRSRLPPPPAALRAPGGAEGGKGSKRVLCSSCVIGTALIAFTHLAGSLIPIRVLLGELF